ncbi:hypothetical protein JCM10049v2_001597 [Rhodotorula toruloides]
MQESKLALQERKEAQACTVEAYRLLVEGLMLQALQFAGAAGTRPFTSTELERFARHWEALEETVGAWFRVPYPDEGVQDFHVTLDSNLARKVRQAFELLHGTALPRRSPAGRKSLKSALDYLDAARRTVDDPKMRSLCHLRIESAHPAPSKEMVLSLAQQYAPELNPEAILGLLPNCCFLSSPTEMDRCLEEPTGDLRMCEREKEDLTTRIGALEERDEWREEQDRLSAEEHRRQKGMLVELQEGRRQREEVEVRGLAIEALLIEALRLALDWQGRPDYRLTPRDMVTIDRAWLLLERRRTWQDSLAAFFSVSDSQTFFAALRAPLARKLRLARHLLTEGQCPSAQQAAEAAHAIATDPDTASIRLARNNLSHPLPDEERVLQLVEEHGDGKVTARDVVHRIIKAPEQLTRVKEHHRITACPRETS